MEAVPGEKVEAGHLGKGSPRPHFHAPGLGNNAAQPALPLLVGHQEEAELPSLLLCKRGIKYF